MLIFPEGQRAALLPHTPQFTIIVDDLSLVSDADLHRRTLDTAAKLALIMLKHADGDLLTALAQAAYLFGELLRAPNGRAAAERLIRYIMLVSKQPIEPKDISGALAPALGPSGEELTMSIGYQLIEQGRVEGLAKGRLEGRVEGGREALKNQLRHKFGPLSPELAAKLQALSEAQLEASMIRIFSADSASAVLEPASPT
jgi:hypothetical protein